MKAYIDTSAVAGAYLWDEPDHEALSSFLFGAPVNAATSDLTRVELTAAFHGAARAGRLDDAVPLIAKALLDVSPSGRIKTIRLDLVRLEGEVGRLLARHRLRAADAIHLATAIVAMGGPEGVRFVTRDLRQAEAASVEGFEVL